MYKKIISYNLEPEELNENFDDFFRIRKRDSFFAGVFIKGNKIYAIRDHLGIVPLYYRRVKNEWKFSFFQSDLMIKTDKIEESAIRLAVSLGTCRFQPLIKDINIVSAGSVLVFNGNDFNQIYKYKIVPQKTPIFTSSDSIYKDFDKLITEIVNKQAEGSKTIGTFLSGGLDSALLAYYLKRTSKVVSCYTSAGWGLNTAELQNAKKRAQDLQISKHVISEVDKGKINLKQVFGIYKDPHLTSPSLAQTQLWMGSDIGKNEAIAFAQGSDTMACSVHSQSNIWIMSLIPHWIRMKIFAGKYSTNVIDNFLTYLHSGILDSNEYQNNIKDWEYQHYTSIQQLTLLGMLYGHTPSDSELFVMLAIAQNKSIINPFYNIDLLENYLSVPLFWRIQIDISNKLKLYIDKKIIKILSHDNLGTQNKTAKKGYTINIDDDVLAKIGDEKWYKNTWHYEYKVRLCLLNNWLILKGYKPYIWA